MFIANCYNGAQPGLNRKNRAVSLRAQLPGQVGGTFSNVLENRDSAERIHFNQWSPKLFVDLAEHVEMRIQRDGGVAEGELLVELFPDHRPGYKNGVDLGSKLVLEIRQTHQRLRIRVVRIIPITDGNRAFRQEQDVGGMSGVQISSQ